MAGLQTIASVSPRNGAATGWSLERFIDEGRQPSATDEASSVADGFLVVLFCNSGDLFFF